MQDLATRINDCLVECYLRSSPPVDLRQVAEDSSVDPNAHTLPISEFSAILKKYDLKISDAVYMFANKSPKLVQA